MQTPAAIRAEYAHPGRRPQGVANRSWCRCWRAGKFAPTTPAGMGSAGLANCGPSSRRWLFDAQLAENPPLLLSELLVGDQARSCNRSQPLELVTQDQRLRLGRGRFQLKEQGVHHRVERRRGLGQHPQLQSPVISLLPKRVLPTVIGQHLGVGAHPTGRLQPARRSAAGLVRGLVRRVATMSGPLSLPSIAVL